MLRTMCLGIGLLGLGLLVQAEDSARPAPWAGDAWQLQLCTGKVAKIKNVYKQDMYVKLGQVYDGTVLVKEMHPPDRIVLQSTNDPGRTREVMRRGREGSPPSAPPAPLLPPIPGTRGPVLEKAMAADFVAAGDSVQDVMTLLGQDCNVSIVVSPAVKGAVTARSSGKVSLAAFLDAILPPLDATYVEENGIIRVMTRQEHDAYLAKAPRARPASPDSQLDRAKVSQFVATGDSIQDVLTLLGQDLHLNVVVSPQVKGNVNANLSGALTLRQILDTILPPIGATYVEKDGIVNVITEPEYAARFEKAQASPEKTPWAGDSWQLLLCMGRTAKVANGEGQEMFVKAGGVYQSDVLVKEIRSPDRIILQRTGDPTRTREVAKGDLIAYYRNEGIVDYIEKEDSTPSKLDTTKVSDFVATGDNIQDVMTLLGQDLNLRIVVSPQVKGNVNANLHGEVTLRALLDTILPPLQAKYVEESSLISIMTTQEADINKAPQRVAEEIRARVFKIKNADLKEVVAQLKRALPEDAEIIVDEPTGLLVVRSTPKNLDKAEDLLRLTDAETPLHRSAMHDGGNVRLLRRADR